VLGHVVSTDVDCGGAAICFIVGLFNWASMKMLINISRSLYNINDAIRSKQSLIEE